MDFFSENKAHLEESYPGISPDIILKYLYFHYDLEKSDKFEFSQAKITLSIIKLLEQLKESTPLEYIFKESCFWNFNIYVNEDVLIPRTETEILAELSVQLIEKNNLKKIVEVGTGSGVLFLSVLINSKLVDSMTVTDISNEALKVAQYNYFLKSYQVQSNAEVVFEQCDRLQAINDKFDLIITNPPYIKREADLRGVHSKVDQFEPHVALYLDDNNYDLWFEEFFAQAYNSLNEGGYFVMEGHEDHLQNQKLQAQKLNFKHAEVIKDFTGSDRFLQLQK